jgi:hypothetical protein
MVKAETICVDFDKTLCVDDQFGDVNKKIRGIIEYYWKRGFKIILYTSRQKCDEKKIVAWCVYHCPFIDEIKFNKPEAVVYIDDRALHPSAIFMKEYIQSQSNKLLGLTK